MFSGYIFHYNCPLCKSAQTCLTAERIAASAEAFTQPDCTAGVPALARAIGRDDREICLGRTDSGDRHQRDCPIVDLYTHRIRPGGSQSSAGKGNDRWGIGIEESEGRGGRVLCSSGGKGAVRHRAVAGEEYSGSVRGRGTCADTGNGASGIIKADTIGGPTGNGLKAAACNRDPCAVIHAASVTEIGTLSLSGIAATRDGKTGALVKNGIGVAVETFGSRMKAGAVRQNCRGFFAGVIEIDAAGDAGFVRFTLYLR